MSTKVINAEKEVARVVASFQSEGHILYARYDCPHEVLLFFRHVNGKKHQVAISDTTVTVVRNGRLLTRTPRAAAKFQAQAQCSSFPAT